jgi:hypothetical protein
MGLSPQQAKLLLDTDTLNLAEKVKAKKSLSPREREMLESIAASGGDHKPNTKTFADNQVELGEILGVNRRTVIRWLKIEGNPGAETNGKYNVTIWREWARINGLKFTDTDDLDKSALQARNILLQNERLELANAEKRKLLIPRELAKQVFTQLIFAAKSRCFTGIPRFVTLARMAKDTVDASEEIRKEFNDIWEQLTNGGWFDEKPIIENDEHQDN